MPRFQDWPFRTKLLFVCLAPVGLVALLTPIGFYLGLETVWQQAVATQSELLRLESLTREYQAEAREYVISRLPETLEEIDEIEEEVPKVLERLRAGAPDRAALADELSELVDRMIQSGSDLKARARSDSGEPRSDSGESLSPDEIEQEMEAFEDVETLLEDKIAEHLQQAENQVSGAFRRFRSLLLVSSLAGLSLGLILALGLARWLDGPLRVLQQASERILDGDYRAGRLLTSKDELGRLAQGFDRAAEDIRELLEAEQQNLQILRDSQEQLIQTGKLAAVGELAAGVAHEINNPLSAVLTYGVLLREKAEQQPPEALAGIPKLIDRLKLIETAALRCKKIADNLLDFARRDESEMGPVDLAQVIEESIRLTGPSCRHLGVKVSRETADDRIEITGNRNQMLQVAVNLINNAAQAAGTDGHVEVGARSAGDIRTLWVKDDGPGIPEELRDRIFDPFVTTKPVGEGTGLGLSIVYGIVQGHNGRVELDTSDRGTTFTVFLPSDKSSGDEGA